LKAFIILTSVYETGPYGHRQSILLFEVVCIALSKTICNFVRQYNWSPNPIAPDLPTNDQILTHNFIQTLKQ